MKPVARWVGKVALARELGVGVRQVENYAADGMPREKRGRAWAYEVEACTVWREARKRPRSVEVVSFEQARARRELAQAQLAEDELGRRRGELYTGTDVDRWTATFGDAVRARVMALPRYAHRVQAAQTFQESHALLELIARELLEGLQIAVQRAGHGRGNRGGRPRGPGRADGARARGATRPAATADRQ